jgi:hypothetical protein
MRLVLADGTLVFLLQSDILLQSYPYFCVEAFNSFGYSWAQSMCLVPAARTLVGF